MTVSRVINKDRAVKPETRERIQAAIAALNYSPNPAARLLAGAPRTRIALVYGNPSSAYLSEVLLGALGEASRSDVQLLLERWTEVFDPAELAGRAEAGLIDGVILPPPFCDDGRIVRALLDSGAPLVLRASADPATAALSVAIDDREAAADMTARLIAAGHRRIGFITGDPNQTATARRLEGYRLALRRAGLSADPALVATGDYSYRSGLAAADQLLRLEPPPTAIFASNDDMAAATIAAAHRRRLETPGDLSVCGFDDTALATTIVPELTTVRQPTAEMTEAALGMLAAAARRVRLGEKPDPERRLFGHVIVERQSVGPPAEGLT